MHVRTLSLCTLLGLLGAGCGGRPPASDEAKLPDFAADAPRPNVLVVLVDVLRRDHLGVYGYPLPTSPRIDAFAAGAHRFERAYSHTNWTKPSVATLFTAVYADQHGLGRVGFDAEGGFKTDVLPAAFDTLAERFSQAGYLTSSWGANIHIQEKTGFAQGFEDFFMRRGTTAVELNRRFQEWYDLAGEPSPFFTYIHYMDVHWPYNQFVEGLGDPFGTTVFPAKKAPASWDQVPKWAERYLDEASLAVLRARYDEEIRYVDTAFGELLDWLDDRGLAGNTIVVFVADHGEGFNEHGHLQHTFPPYEEVTGIPLLIRLPAVYDLPPRVIEPVVGLVDVMPTLLDLVGVPSPPYVEGRSVVPLLTGGALPQRPIYISGEGRRGLRTGDRTFLAGEDSRECYDLEEDPAELEPLADSAPCSRLESALETLLGRFELMAAASDPNSTVTLDEEELAELKALGYLE